MSIQCRLFVTEDPLPLSTKENVETSDTSPVTEAGPPQVVLDSPDTEVPDRGEEDNGELNVTYILSLNNRTIEKTFQLKKEQL